MLINRSIDLITCDNSQIFEPLFPLDFPPGVLVVPRRVKGGALELTQEDVGRVGRPSPEMHYMLFNGALIIN